MRLRLVEFYNRVRNYVKTIISILDTLRTIKTIFNSGDRVWPDQCEDAIECLTQMSEQSREFHAFIKRSNHLPLAVVPLRLPLIMALQDADAQIAKLNRFLVVFRNEGWITLDQPVEQLLDIKREMEILLVKNDEVLSQVSILLDRARFKEREYSAV